MNSVLGLGLVSTSLRSSLIGGLSGPVVYYTVEWCWLGLERGWVSTGVSLFRVNPGLFLDRSKGRKQRRVVAKRGTKLTNCFDATTLSFRYPIQFNSQSWLDRRIQGFKSWLDRFSSLLSHPTSDQTGQRRNPKGNVNIIFTFLIFSRIIKFNK